MGMDVHGLNPKMNKDKSKFPMLVKVDKLEKDEKWKERLELIETESDKYWKERDEFEGTNKGVYFRNNCWWWRPLWDFCYSEYPSLITQETYFSGHHNDGAGLNDEDAKLLGAFLLKAIEDGNADDYKDRHESQQKDEDYKYPFDVENVEAFAHFCIESGGFEIC